MFTHLILFGWFLFKNKARGGSGNFEKGGGKIESTPLYSTFKLKYRKNVKLTIFLMETSVKAQK